MQWKLCVVKNVRTLSLMIAPLTELFIAFMNARKTKQLSGTTKLLQKTISVHAGKGKKVTQTKLVSVSYKQNRLEFFREQLAAANRRLGWSMKHNPDWYDQAEKGEVVSFYEWAVEMAEKEVERN